MAWSSAIKTRITRRPPLEVARNRRAGFPGWRRAIESLHREAGHFQGSADRGQALFEAPKAVSGRLLHHAPAVVEHFDLELAVRLAQADLAMPGARMPDHVRRRLADHPTEHGFGLSVERTYAQAHVDLESSRFEGELSGAQLGGQRRLPVAGYRIPHLPEDASWAWMLTGQHMSPIFTVAGDRTAFTPMFTGAQPLQVPNGLYAGWQV